MSMPEAQIRAVREAAKDVKSRINRALAGEDVGDIKALRREAEEVVDHLKIAKESEELIRLVDEAMYGGPASSGGGGSFYNAVKAAGFDRRANPTVEIQLTSAIGQKAPTLPAVTDWSRTEPVISGLGQDIRFVYPFLQQERVDGEAAVTTYRQTGARTVTGTVERALNATTDKATLATTLTLAVEALKQQAILIDGIPNAVLESVNSLREFLESEGRFQINKALDSHVFAQIVAAAPPFGTTGTTLVDKVRNGIASMRATGFSPDLLVVNPTDGASLDLTADAGGYVFATRDSGTSSPLWNTRVIERIGAGTEPPYLIDTSALGVLYTATLRIEADPFAGAGGANFKKNLTDLRFELKALFHVRQAEGARRIAAT